MSKRTLIEALELLEQLSPDEAREARDRLTREYGPSPVPPPWDHWKEGDRINQLSGTHKHPMGYELLMLSKTYFWHDYNKKLWEITPEELWQDGARRMGRYYYRDDEGKDEQNKKE